MNKIYKIVFSKARNCYMVVSELAKGQTKSASTKKIVLSALVGISLLAFTGINVNAAPYTAGGGLHKMEQMMLSPLEIPPM